MLIIITGSVNAGKSTFLKRLAAAIRAIGGSVGGVIQEAIWEGDRKAGYNVINVADESRTVFGRWDKDSDEARPLAIRKDGIAFGQRALDEAVRANRDVVFVDELGPLELRERGYYDVARTIPALDEAGHKLVVVVRDTVITSVMETFGLSPTMVLPIQSGPNPLWMASVLLDRAPEPL